MARRLGILSILALGLAMSGLSGHQADTAAAAETAPMTLKVVLLGDSYSAGNGARDFDGKSAYFGPSPCHRSHVNWSERYVAWLTAQGYHVTFLNRACSDGVTKDLVTPRQMDVTTFLPDRFGTDEEMLAQARADDPCNDGAYPDEQYWEYGLGGISNLGERYLTCTRFLKAQTDAIGPDTDLVLFTNGGNDIKFSDIVKQCFVIGSRSPGTAARRSTTRATTSPEPWRASRPPSTRCAATACATRRRSSTWATRSSPRTTATTSPAGSAWAVTTTRSPTKCALGLEGNRQQAELIANDNLNHPGQVRFIDNVPAYFEGHEPDGSATNRNPDRWLNEFLEPSKTDQREWYHPNNLGHEAYKDLLVGASPLVTGGDTTASGDIDIVFTIDTTGSMGSYIAQVKQYAQSLIDQVNAQTNSARFALVSYRDDPAWTGYSGDYPARVESGFTTDPTALKSAINGLSVNGGGDWPETMYSGVDAALDLPWRPGVKKVVIVLADAPPHDPEPISGLTGQDVIDHALAVDPAEVYVVDTGSAVSSSLANVVSSTGGSSVDSSTADVPGALLALLQSAIDKPYGWINGPYTQQVGLPVTIDGSGSYATTGDLVSYAWDYDGDGVVDETTTSPVVTHTWATPYFGIMSLTVTDTEGAAAWPPPTSASPTTATRSPQPRTTARTSRT
ncbi:MAG: VWA domain-containing protein [Nocardioides sp.]